MRSSYRSLALAIALPALLAGVAAPAAAQAAAAARPAAPAAAPRLDDATIVAIFDAANTADIETGALAAKRASSPEVRKLGAMFQRDHGQVRQQGRDLAKRLGVTPTPPSGDASARDHAAAMRKLRGLRGAAFDRAFLEHEIAFHQAVIDAIGGTLMPAIHNPELRALVERVAPAFQAHMAAAKRLQQEVALR